MRKSLGVSTTSQCKKSRLCDVIFCNWKYHKRFAIQLFVSEILHRKSSRNKTANAKSFINCIFIQKFCHFQTTLMRLSHFQLNSDILLVPLLLGFFYETNNKILYLLLGNMIVLISKSIGNGSTMFYNNIHLKFSSYTYIHSTKGSPSYSRIKLVEYCTELRYYMVMKFVCFVKIRIFRISVSSNVVDWLFGFDVTNQCKHQFSLCYFHYSTTRRLVLRFVLHKTTFLVGAFRKEPDYYSHCFFKTHSNARKFLFNLFN